jgi:hypothetical protein
MFVDEIDLALQCAARIVERIESRIEDTTINWRTGRFNGLMIQDLSEDDSIFHCRFRKRYLQEFADKLWPRIEQFLQGDKLSIVFSNGNYSAPYESLLLMVLFRFPRPRRLRKEMEGFFGYTKSKISTGIRDMVHALHSFRHGHSLISKRG